jgi:hypothetical protein
VLVLEVRRNKVRGKVWVYILENSPPPWRDISCWARGKNMKYERIKRGKFERKRKWKDKRKFVRYSR